MFYQRVNDHDQALLLKMEGKPAVLIRKQQGGRATRKLKENDVEGDRQNAE